MAEECQYEVVQKGEMNGRERFMVKGNGVGDGMLFPNNFELDTEFAINQGHTCQPL